jgi:hypothetical protein
MCPAITGISSIWKYKSSIPRFLDKCYKYMHLLLVEPRDLARHDVCGNEAFLCDVRAYGILLNLLAGINVGTIASLYGRTEWLR